MIKLRCPGKECDGMIDFTFREARPGFKLKCGRCGEVCELPPSVADKLNLLEELMKALRKAKPILGKTSVRIDVHGQGVSIPYYLLLTRMTTELALDIEEEGFNFSFLIEPLETGREEENDG